MHTFELDGDTVQEITNVIVPEAAEYNMTVYYSGRGEVQFRLNNKEQGAVSLDGSGEYTVTGLKALISDSSFQFTGEHYNNIRFSGERCV